MDGQCRIWSPALVAVTLGWFVSAPAYELHGLDGRPIPLQQCDSVVTVQFDHDVTPGELGGMMAQEPGLVDQYPAFHLGGRFWRAWPGPWSGFMKNDEAGC
jgi:hypothetical protein